MHEFFFHLIFPCANIFFVLCPPTRPSHKFSNGPSLNSINAPLCVEPSVRQLTCYLYVTIKCSRENELPCINKDTIPLPAFHLSITLGIEVPFESPLELD